MLKKLLIILSVYFILASDEIQAESEYRLPNQTYPESYLVNLQFQDIDQTLTYEGSVIININILEDTDTITLHSSVKNITRLTLIQESVNFPLSYKLDRDKEFLIINGSDSDKFINNTTVAIKIQFIGGIEEFPTTHGIYRGIYLDENLAKVYFLATHMQPTYARKVFPCYDEPRYKSVFNLTITHKSGYHAISNMDSFLDTDRTELLGIFTRKFEQTPLMPAYSLGFVISDFKYNEFENIQSGIKFRVFSPPNRLDKTNFGFLTGIRALNLFEIYFDTKYELKKLDLVALPQLAFDGIENLGITFYREELFLYEKHKDTLYKMELISRNIVNGICQTLLGSILTHDWWSSLWLNKGLCKFYEYRITNSIYPEMRLNNLFAVEAMEPEMNRDSSPFTRPMTSYVETPSDKESIFDSISYNKAASVIRMFHHALSEETFRHGLQIYINKSTSNPKGIAEPKDFYSALQLAVNDSTVNVARMFETWEFQAGYPILYVTRNYNGNNIRFSQKRFTDDIKDETEYNELWSIPITYSSKFRNNSNTNPQFWLHQWQIEKKFEELKPSDYFIVNIDQTGYYRVMYDEPNWIAIAKELNEGDLNNFSPNTRAMLIDDAGVFVQAEILDIRIFLDIIKYLRLETDYIPWISATNNLLYMRRMLNDESSKLYNDFQKFLQNLFTKVFETYGVQELNDYEHHQKHIRNLAINWACQAHLPACLTQTEDLFNKGIINSEVTISTDHRAAIMCSGAIPGNFSTLISLWNLYKNSDQASEKSLYLKSIGCIESREILKDFIERYSRVADDEWFTVIQSVYLNGPIGLSVALEFLNNEFENFNIFINERTASNSLDLIFQGIADRVITDEMHADFTNLMVQYKLSKNITISLNATIVKNLEWINKNSPIIDEFLNSSRMITVSLSVILIGIFIQVSVK